MGSQSASNNTRAWKPSGGVRKRLLLPQSWGCRDRVGTYHMALYEEAQSHKPTTRWYLHSRLVGYFQIKCCYKKKNRKPLPSPSHPANPSAAILNGWCPSQHRLPRIQQRSKSSGLTPDLCITHCGYSGGSSHLRFTEPSGGADVHLRAGVCPSEDHWHA